MNPYLSSKCRKYVSFALALFTIVYVRSLAQVPQSASTLPLRYEAEFEKGNGLARQAYHLFRDGTKYRLEYNLGSAINNESAARTRVVEIFDGSNPQIIWMCFGNSACPSIASLNHAYYLAAQREGETVITRRYNLPGATSLWKDLPKSPSSSLPTKPILGDLKASKRGIETIAGHPCDIFDGNILVPEVNLNNGMKGKRPDVNIRAWVEPKTQLVLKYDKTIIFANSQVPPQHESLVVKKLTLFDRMPQELFQLPPGTKVSLPEIFRDIKLPNGVSATHSPVRPPKPMP